MWATGGAPELDEAAADAEQIGIPALAERLREAAKQDRGFGIWRQNWDIVIAFLAIDTQWRIVPVGQAGTYWQGLDYASVKVGLDAGGHVLTPRQWDGLRTMERAAAKAMNGARG